MNKLQQLVLPFFAFALSPAFVNAQNSYPDSGNVGIGTINPQSALQIGEYLGNNQSKITFPGVYNFEKMTLGQNGNGNSFFEFLNHASATHSYGVKIGTSVDLYGQGLYITAAPAADSYETLQYGSAPAVFINTANNVGIGTSYPQGYKLAVAGNMIAEKIKVKLQGAWPDYVFKKEYILRPLLEVSRFIAENGHLPDMPSAAEVKKEGIDMEEMNKALLKKIEELTLYLIDMDKKVKALEELNKVSAK